MGFIKNIKFVLKGIQAARAAKKVAKAAGRQYMADEIKPGKETSEFKSKNIVQAVAAGLAILNVFLPETGLDKDIAVLMAGTIVAGVEAAYSLGRSIVKGLSARKKD